MRLMLCRSRMSEIMRAPGRPPSMAASTCLDSTAAVTGYLLVVLRTQGGASGMRRKSSQEGVESGRREVTQRRA
jgi:hypothetical protein